MMITLTFWGLVRTGRLDASKSTIPSDTQGALK